MCSSLASQIGWSKVGKVSSGGETLSSPGAALIVTEKGKKGIFLSAVDTWKGKDYWRYVVGWDVSPQGEAIWTTVREVSSGGNTIVGGGICASDMNGNGVSDIVIVGIDTWKGKDYWRYAIGWDINSYGEANWTEIKQVPSGGDNLIGGGVALGDLNDNNKMDIVIAGIDHWEGKDYWRYVIGLDVKPSGDANWGSVKTVPSGGNELEGGGVALADINGNGKLDIVLAALDVWEGKDYWRYVIGWDISPQGEANWTQVRKVPSGGEKLRGGGVFVYDLDGNGKMDIILSAVDTWEGKDYWRYVIGWDVDSYGQANWGEVQKVPSGANKLLGGGVLIGNLNENDKPEIILYGIDTWEGKDYWRYIIGFDISR